MEEDNDILKSSHLNKIDEALLSNIVLSSDDGIEALSLDGKIIFWNKGCEKLYGYKAQEVIDKSILIVYPQNLTDEFTDLFSKIKKEKHIEPYVTQRKKNDGTIIEVAISASPIRNNNGVIIGASVITRPFAGKERVARYARTLIESSLDPFITISAEAKITDVNEAAIQISGISREKLIGSDFSTFFTEPEQALQMYRLVYSAGFVTNYPLIVPNRLGKMTDVLCNGSVYKDEKEDVLGVFVALRDITSQKQAARYARSLIEASLDPLATISLEGKITDVNEAMTKTTGVARNDLIGTDFISYFTEPDKAKIMYESVVKKGFVTDYPLVMRDINGNQIDVIYNASDYKDDNGNILGIFAAARNIAQQKQIAHYTRSLIEASLDPLVTINPEGKITDVNEATVEVTGVSREELIGSDFSNYFTEPDEAREGYQQAFKEGFVRNYPLAIRHISGSVTYVLYNAKVYRDPQGNILGVFAAARDITQRKKIEEQLHVTFAYARSLIESSLDSIVTISSDGKITDINHATEALTGVTREWLIGSDFSDYFTEPKKAREGYRLVLKTGSVHDYPLVIRRANGQLIDVSYNATVFRDAKGMPQGVFAIARDVTELKKTAQYARSLLEASLDPLFAISPEGKVTDINEAAIKVTGFSSNQLIGTDFSLYFTDPKQAKMSYEEVFKKGYFTNHELTIESQEGKLTNVLCNAAVYKSESGKILGALVTVRDFSHLKEAAEKLKTMNQDLDAFTYSVAHDLKAPLRAIDGFSKILLEDYSEKMGEEGKRVISVITSNTQRMIELIENLLQFSHIGKSELKKETLNMNYLANLVYQELKKNVPDRDIKLKTAGLANINGDSSLIRQVWENILSNAIKFTQTKKQAVIEIGSKDAGNDVIYYVKDNGVGFDMKYVKKLFGVFQRLHGQEFEGTGIGLANVKKIIDRHHGKVWAEGKVGEGATFYFSLPKE